MNANPPRPLSVAVLVKQVPRPDSLRLGADGRLAREGIEREMNPYCRRAVSAGVETARASGGRCTVITLGPPSAEDCLREAIACGADDGVLISDPAFAGSDTLATARALAAALRLLGPFDLILCGRNSVDADTAQMPAQLAELLDLPMAAGVKELHLGDGRVEVRCEHDDGWLAATVAQPALLTCAERLIAPAKAKPEQRAAVSADRIRHLDAAGLGPGPWGEAASPTRVGQIRQTAAERLGLRFDGGSDAEVGKAVRIMAEHDAFRRDRREPAPASAGTTRHAPQGTVAVLAEPGRTAATRELLAAADQLAGRDGRVAVLVVEPLDERTAGEWGADLVVPVTGARTEEDIAPAVADWCADQAPWAVLAPSTMWGREVAARASARLGAGLVGDAVELGVDERGLVCWKPAFSGSLVAAITCVTAIQFATVRSGALSVPAPTARRARQAAPLDVTPRDRVVVTERTRDDDVNVLDSARAVVSVGTGVAPEDYARLEPLLDALGASLAATRKVTDRGWQPRARQIGITGCSIAPRLFVAIGASGGFNHMAGARAADFVVAVNNDPEAPVFDAADIGLVGDWRDAVPLLTEAVAAWRGDPAIAGTATARHDDAGGPA